MDLFSNFKLLDLVWGWVELVHGCHGQSERWGRAWQLECVGLCDGCSSETGLRRDNIFLILTLVFPDRGGGSLPGNTFFRFLFQVKMR